MRVWEGTASYDPRAVERIDSFLHEVSAALGRVNKGQKPDGSGTVLASGGVTSHHKLTDLTNFDDHPQYLYLAGRSGGQTAYGGPTTSAASTDTLTLAAYQYTGAIGSQFNASLVLGTNVAVRADNWTLNERNDSGTAVPGITHATGSATNQLGSVKGFVNTTHYGSYDILGTSTSVVPQFTIEGYNTGATSVNFRIIPRLASTGTAQTGNLAEFYGTDNARKSFIAVDGSWNGPVNSTGGTTSGWSRSGTVVSLTTVTDSVGIGTAAPAANVQLTLAAQAAQTADIFDVQNSTPTTLFQIDASGNFLFGTGAPFGTGTQFARFGVNTGGAASGAGVLLADASGFTGEVQTVGLTANRVWQWPDASGTFMTNISTTTVSNKTLTGSTNTIQLDSGATAGTFFRKGSSGVVGVNVDIGPISASRKLTYQDFSAVMPLVGKTNTAAAAGTLAGVDATAQAADIATTNLTTTAPAGMYHVLAVIEDTTADGTAGVLTLTISWTDDVGATTATQTQTLAVTGRAVLDQVCYLASGNITYATTHTGIYGTAKYALRIRVIALN